MENGVFLLSFLFGFKEVYNILSLNPEIKEIKYSDIKGKRLYLSLRLNSGNFCEICRLR